MAETPVLTVGHSTRPLPEFLSMLTTHRVTMLADVRAMPRSARNPQFNRDTLPAALAAHGISYVHRPGLGGLRRPLADSPNQAWRNAGFRGFADYMQSDAFERELLQLLELRALERVAIMCAEAVPWRCHRSLIADALVARGVPVEHILSAASAEPHRLTRHARVLAGRVSYPGPGELLGS